MTKPGYTDLINAALVSIGQEPIVSLDNVEDISPTVTAVKAKVDIVKRKLLRCNDWNCARVTTSLAQLANVDTRGTYCSRMFEGSSNIYKQRRNLYRFR